MKVCVAMNISLLRFTNVVPGDYMGGSPYACMALNNIMRDNKQGPLHFMTPTGQMDYTPVDYLWADQSDMISMRGDTFNIKVIDYLDIELPLHHRLKKVTEEACKLVLGFLFFF